MIRLEAKRAIEKITQLMGKTESARKEIMEKNKLRMPNDYEIDNILSKFKEELE